MLDLMLCSRYSQIMGYMAPDTVLFFCQVMLVFMHVKTYNEKCNEITKPRETKILN